MTEDAPTLTHQEAFAFATTWRAHLRGCVKLEVEQSPASLFSAAEWVSFNLSGSDNVLNKCDYARATTAVWFALSCCEGFSGTENPRFWQQIFSQWNDAHAQPPPKPGLRFFPDKHNAPFPRILLKFGQQPGPTQGVVVPTPEALVRAASTGIRIFLGLLPSFVEAVDADVRTILEKLAPFIREKQSQRRVAIAIDAQEGSHIAKILTEKLVAEAQPPTDSIETFCNQKFQITTIVTDQFQSAEALSSLDAELPLCDVTVTRTPLFEQIVLDGQLFRGLLRRMPRQPQRKTDQLPQWRVSGVHFTMGSSQKISTLCSALPHIPSVLSLDVRGRVPEIGEKMSSSSSDWAWLGYAAFHPDAASHSSLTSISIEIHSASEEDLVAFEAMARGNNLCPEGEIQAVASDLYVEGFVESTTSVWMLPGDRSGNMLQSYVSMSWVTICVSSIEEGIEQEWLCVMNPGIGFGHLRGSDVSEWRSRPPGQPSIRSVRIGEVPSTSSSMNQRVLDERVMRLLRLVGGSLTSLDWQGSQHVSTFTMLDLRAYCPHLKYLRVGHDGVVWADLNETTNWPQLEELELDIATRTDLLQRREVRPILTACLPKLKALKLTVERNSFTSSKATVEQILKNHKALEFLWWSSKHAPSSWTQQPDRSAKREFERHVQELELDEVTPPSLLPRRLAFLSVVDASATCRRGNFDSNLSALVFAFEFHVVPREIFIDL